jgi:hypothetical protein
MRPLLFPDDLQFWYETLRWLGLAAYGGADFGEVRSSSPAMPTRTRAGGPPTTPASAASPTPPR